MPELIDFTPLSRIGEHFAKAQEEERQRALWEKLAPQLVGLDQDAAAPPAGPLASAPAAPAAPRATPAFAGGGTSMAMPADPKIEQIALDRADRKSTRL